MKVDQEARVTMKVLSAKGHSGREIARMLGIDESTVRYHLQRIRTDAGDGRADQPQCADAVSEAIGIYLEHAGGGPLNVAALHDWLRAEHDYAGSLRSVQRYVRRHFPKPKRRARRRVETPPELGRAQPELPALRARGALPHRRVSATTSPGEGQDRAWHPLEPRDARDRRNGLGKLGGASGVDRRARARDVRAPELPRDGHVGARGVGAREVLPRGGAAAPRAVRSRADEDRGTRLHRGLRGPSLLGAVRVARSADRGARVRTRRPDVERRRDPRRAPAPRPRASRARSGAHEGEATDTVLPPMRLGKMGRRLQEIAAMAPAQRPLDLYAALAEVAR